MTDYGTIYNSGGIFQEKTVKNGEEMGKKWGRITEKRQKKWYALGDSNPGPND